MSENRWSVKQVVPGRWGVFHPNGSWHDVFDNLKEAHTYATQQAVADELYQPGGLTYLSKLKQAALWQARQIMVIEGWRK